MNAREALGRAEDGLAGRFGLLFLTIGFGLQLIGYAIALVVEDSPGNEWARAVTALALGAFVVPLALLLYVLLESRQLKRTLIRVAQYDNSGRLASAPYGGQLYGMGDYIWPRRTDESEVAYAARVFGVSSIIPGWPAEWRPPAWDSLDE